MSKILTYERHMCHPKVTIASATVFFSLGSHEAEAVRPEAGSWLVHQAVESVSAESTEGWDSELRIVLSR